MIIAAQGTSGAGKTTTLVNLEQRLPSAEYVPEIILSSSSPDDEFFVSNDIAKSLSAQNTAEEIALMDRDFTSTLAVIAARDGLSAESYTKAERYVRQQIEMGRLVLADTYFLFYVPMEVSIKRQAPSNHPMWRDHTFVKKFDQALDEVRERFIDESSVIRIDGTETPEAITNFCIKGILANMQFEKDEVHLDRPYIQLPETQESGGVELENLTDTAMVVLKPDAKLREINDAIIEEIKQRGFEIITQKEKVLSPDDILHLWPKFWTESWWRDAVEYMTSGESTGLLCRHPHLQGQALHDQLLEIKRCIRQEYRDETETRPQVSILHTSQDHKELELNVHAFWTVDELRALEVEND